MPDAPQIKVRKGRFPYTSDVPHQLVLDPGPPADYVLVTALRGTVVFSVNREDIVT